MMSATSASLVAPTKTFLPEWTVYCLVRLPLASSSCSSVVSSSRVTGQPPRSDPAGRALHVRARRLAAAFPWRPERAQRTFLHRRRDLPLLQLQLANFLSPLSHFLEDVRCGPPWHAARDDPT